MDQSEIDNLLRMVAELDAEGSAEPDIWPWWVFAAAIGAGLAAGGVVAILFV